MRAICIFTPVGDSIRFGMAAIKNVGENTAKAIRESRLSQGPFKSLYEFCERIESRFLNKRVFESLIKCGAMDSLGRAGTDAGVGGRCDLGDPAGRAREGIRAAWAVLWRWRDERAEGAFRTARCGTVDGRRPAIERIRDAGILRVGAPAGEAMLHG